MLYVLLPIPYPTNSNTSITHDSALRDQWEQIGRKLLRHMHFDPRFRQPRLTGALIHFCLSYVVWYYRKIPLITSILH